MMFDDVVPWGTHTFMFYVLRTFLGDVYMICVLIFMKKYVFSLIKLIQEFYKE